MAKSRLWSAESLNFTYNKESLAAKSAIYYSYLAKRKHASFTSPVCQNTAMLVIPREVKNEGKVANPARGQMDSRENEYSPVPACA